MPMGCPGRGSWCSTPLCCVRSLDFRLFFRCAGAVLMRPDNGAVDHGVFVVGISGQVLKNALPNPVLGPAAEAPMGVVPAPQSLWQVAPRNSGAVSIQNRFDESAIVL